MCFKSVFPILIAMLISPVLLRAQTEETLAGSASHTGGFGGPFFITSAVNDQVGGGAGGGGAFIINNFFIGGFGQGETFGKIRYDDKDFDLSIGYGGFWLGYVVPSHKLVHLYSSVKIGWGGAVLSERNDSDFDDEFDVEYSDNAFVVHPELGIELNATHWFRIAGVGGYRFMNNVNDIPTFRSEDFDSATFSLVFRFGGFGYR